MNISWLKLEDPLHFVRVRSQKPRYWCRSLRVGTRLLTSELTDVKIAPYRNSDLRKNQIGSIKLFVLSLPQHRGDIAWTDKILPKVIIEEVEEVRKCAFLFSKLSR